MPEVYEPHFSALAAESRYWHVVLLSYLNENSSGWRFRSRWKRGSIKWVGINLNPTRLGRKHNDWNFFDRAIEAGADSFVVCVKLFKRVHLTLHVN